MRRLTFCLLVGIATSLPVSAKGADLENFFFDLIDSLDTVFEGVAEIDDGVSVTEEVAAFITDDYAPGEALSNLSTAAFSQFQQFPVGSTVAGFTYEFDPNLAIFVRSSQGLGPVLAERAQTNGKGKLNLSMAYSRIAFDVFEGDDLDDLSVTLDGTQPATISSGDDIQLIFPSQAGDFLGDPEILVRATADIAFGPGDTLDFDIDGTTMLGDTVGENLLLLAVNGEVSEFTGSYEIAPNLPLVKLDAEIDVDLYAMFANYGVTDWLDLGIVVPILTISLKGKVTSTGIFETQPFIDEMRLVPDTIRQSNRDRKTGIGDIILRGKARLFETDYGDLATRLDVSLPTGDEDNLFGRGNGAIFGQVIVSEQFGRFSPHVNLGLFFDLEDHLQNQLRYAAGVDVRVHERVTIAADVVGSRDLDDDEIGDNQINVSGGLKVNVWRRLIVSGNALVRLNDEGLRADVIPSGSIEYTFF